MVQKTIYDVIGGQPTLATVVDEFYWRVLADPVLEPYFEGISLKQLKAHQEAYLSRAFGGAIDYDGRTLREAHAGRGITSEVFDRVLKHMSSAFAVAGIDETTAARMIAILGDLRGEIVCGSDLSA